MTALTLKTHRVEKPWGRRDLAPLFPNQPDSEDPVGEIWFDDPTAKPRELLIKYLFTSQRLSVQVHPDDAQAHVLGYPRGKDEAWVVLAAAPDSTIALGLTKEMGPAEVRAAALDGSIEKVLHWQPVKVGDVIYSPAGTIHAIGGNLRVVEIQQNLDLTYRFYDYGSERPLQLDEAMAVSDLGPFKPIAPPRQEGEGRSILSENVAFVLEKWTMAGSFTLCPGTATLWVMPVEGEVTIDGDTAHLGSVIIVEGASTIEIAPNSTIFIAYPGSRAISGLAGSGAARLTVDSSAAVTG